MIKYHETGLEPTHPTTIGLAHPAGAFTILNNKIKMQNADAPDLKTGMPDRPVDWSGHEGVEISPMASWHDADGELALFHIETKKYFGLNPVASEIWRYLAKQLPFGEIIDRLSNAYDAEPVIIAVEVRRVIVELLQAGLLIPTNCPEAANL